MIRALQITLILILFGAHNVLAQGDAKSALRTTSNQVMVGDRAKVFLEVSHDPAQSTVVWPQIPDSFGKLEVLEKGRIDTIRNGGEVVYRQGLGIAGFDSGVFSIPPISVEIQPKLGSRYVLNTNPLSLLVQTVPVDTTKPIKPIKDIINIQRTWTDSLALIVGGALLIILLIIIVVLYSRRKKPAPPAPKTSEMLPKVWALQQLDELDTDQLWQQGEVKEYYVRLTNILRSYIERAFGTSALESTTDELMDMVRRHPILRSGASHLQQILPMADLAKFAKAAPSPDEHVAAMIGAKEFINITAPAVVPAPDANPVS